MRSDRRYGRRALDRNGGGAPSPPSALEIIARNLTERVAESTALKVKHGVHDAVRWTVLRLVLGGVAVAMLTAGIVLLMGAGVTGLLSLEWPLWAASLAVGLFALLVALLAMRGALKPDAAR